MEATKQIKRGQIDKAFIRAATKPESFNEESMTMDVVFTTGHKGLRQTWFGDYYEELSLDESAIRLDRLNNGAPLLMDHDASLKSTIGVVEKAFVKNGEGIAKVRFSRNPEDAGVIQKIRDGIIRKISVGYFVYRYEELAAPEGEPVTYRATDWEPVEISFVAIPFDDGAQSRSGQKQKVECELILRESGENMEKEIREEEKPVEAAPAAEEKAPEAPAEKAPEAAPAEEKAPEEQGSDLAEQVSEQERERAVAITQAVRIAGLGEDFGLELIKSKRTLEQAQAEIHKRWVEKGNTVEVNNRVETKERGGIDHLVRGVTNALQHRANSKVALTEEGRQFRGMRLTRLAEMFLREAGYKTERMSDYEIAKKALSIEYHQRAGAHGTSDFPSLLADVANNNLLSAYQETPQTFDPFVRRVTASDFKNVNRVRLGEAPSLELLPQDGDVQYGTLSDNKEVYALKTYAKGLKITREALVNDDTDAFSRLPTLMGSAVSRLESDLVYTVLTANAAMGDSVALFHADHGNLGTAGTVSETTLTEMRKLGRLQTGLDEVAQLNIIHRYLIVPAALEVAAMKQLALIDPAQASNVNVFSSLYKLIVEPRIDAYDAQAWFAAADPSQIDTLELMTLEGQSGPQIDSEMEFDSLAVKMKVVHDVAAKAIDYRGVFKNAGH